jgi:hypothetical protein
MQLLLGFVECSVTQRLESNRQVPRQPLLASVTKRYERDLNRELLLSC